MTSTTGIQVKLFMGPAVNPELRLQLKESSRFQQAKLSSSDPLSALTLINFQNKEYLGIYLPEEELSLETILDFEKMIQQKIVYYCPDLITHTFKSKIFSQIFIA